MNRRHRSSRVLRKLFLILAVLALSRGICAVLPQRDYPDWDAALEAVVLTGDARQDLLAVAESQVGYEESGDDYIVTESGRRLGYTRYGDWYGIPYGDWCAMFAAFCLRYAAIDSIPLESSCARWIRLLQEAGLYQEAGGTPSPGDLVFFALDGQGVCNHMGIVETADDGGLTAIEGNSDDRVQKVRYPLDDPRILGYGLLPSG